MPNSKLNADDGVVSGSTGLKTTGGDTGILEIQTNGTTRATVDASGNVGIGTSSPASILHVDNGIITTQRYGSSGALVLRSANGTQSSPTQITTSVATAIIAGRGYDGSEYRDVCLIQIVSDGTISNTSSPGFISFATTAAGSVNPSERLRITSTGTLTSQPTYDNTASGSTVVVTSAGLIRRTSSSLKYKKDVEDLDSELATNAVENLRPVWYRTKNAEGDDKATWSHIGLIAEEVHEVEPRLVRYRTVDVTNEEVPVLDADGNPVLNEDGTPQTINNRVETILDKPEPEDVDYGRLAVLLLAEVKTLKAELKEAKDRITALENKE
jgi:hypothetical protein